jgi:hypothetical protein
MSKLSQEMQFERCRRQTKYRSPTLFAANVARYKDSNRTLLKEARRLLLSSNIFEAAKAEK